MAFTLPKDYSPGHTYADYLNWEGRWELIDGMPHAMSPLPSGKHRWICLELAGQLRDALKGCDKCKVSLPLDWKVSDSTVVQPDLLVACFPFIDSSFIEDAPVVVVEVLSPSTRQKDLTVKRSIYLDQQVMYYLIIDPEKEQFTVLQLADGDYVEVAKGHSGSYTFDLANDCSATVDFSGIWS
jgi:Uma2 family endonuclease